MTPEQFATVLLGIVGVALQLIFKYVPKLSDWYQALNKKGLWMLGFVTLAGLGYIGLACTPFADQVGITLACSGDNVFVLAKALFIIANAQQLTYLFTKNSAKG